MQAWVIDALASETDQALTTYDSCTIAAAFPIDTRLRIGAIHLVAGVILARAFDASLIGWARDVGAGWHTATHRRRPFDAAVFSCRAVKLSAWIVETDPIETDLSVWAADRVAAVIDAFACETCLSGRTVDVDAQVLADPTVA